MKLYKDCGFMQIIRIDRDELEDMGEIKKNDLIRFGNAYYKVYGAIDDGHGNKILILDNPVTVHEYNCK